MQALNPSSISNKGTISSKSHDSLEGEIGGVGIEFCHIWSDALTRDDVSSNPMSETTSDLMSIIVVDDGFREAGRPSTAHKLSLDANSVSDTVDVAFEV